MAYTCPKCGAMNYPNDNINYGCECCGYNGTKVTTSNGAEVKIVDLKESKR